ncbi:ThuA domain-containing protein [Agromyces atrinae]|uniref:ThuA domain-containing protein n=1 Tax=Agromyces atrinae TaxID=592376 RepID=UPI001F56F2CC|nr:ThuA domain-containing protein [Agromyces atrinae]MCI2957160.1 ThuA domain-containing protein [Agromyces atrinae]
MSRVLVFSGGGDYVDPWHPFAETSAVVATLLRDAGHVVTVVDSLDDLKAALPEADVLVVNAGGGPAPHPHDERLAAILASTTTPLLALHVAATLLPAGELWEQRLGGRWVRGESMHPAQGPLGLRSVSTSPIVTGLGALETVDEAYSWLRVADDAEVLLVHDHDDTVHPVCWIVDRGGRRSAYDALGHDVGAYEAPFTRELVTRLVEWLAEAPSTPPLPAE